MGSIEHTAPRRTFLRQLATLPLIGGSMAIIGAPRAVAEPMSKQLLAEYVAWLGFEHDRASYELVGKGHREVMRSRMYHGPAHEFHRYGTLEYDGFGCRSPAASSRAALVLSAVGCDWRG